MTTSVFVNDVRVPEQHRSLITHTVKGIAGSFEDIGQQMPITFYWDDDTPVLIAGNYAAMLSRATVSATSSNAVAAQCLSGAGRNIFAGLATCWLSRN